MGVRVTNPDGSNIPFITFGANGITYIRRQTPGTGELWDEYIDSTGHVVTSPVSSTGGTFDFIGGVDFQFIGGTYFDFI